MKNAFIALGSNLGDRQANLANAVARLVSGQVRLVRASRMFETEPRDMQDQPWFLNQVIEIETSLFPRQLLNKLKKIEREMGRKPAPPKGPRLIDLDILFYANAVIQTPDMEIPHPRLGERRFVLEPLAELAPELRHPVTKRTVREMLTAVGSQKVAPVT